MPDRSVPSRIPTATALQRESRKLRHMPASDTTTPGPKAHPGRILIPFHVVAVAMLAALTLLPSTVFG